MKKYSPAIWFVILIALLPAGYLALVWNSLPQTVPVHFGPDMQPDKYGNKSELWLITGILVVVSIGLYFLLNNLHRIDPKRKGGGGSATFGKLAGGLVVFMAVLNVIIIATAKGAVAMQDVLLPLLGFLFAFIGNYMNHIKPNYFAGIRLPWTLSSNENWRRTHQLAGKLWFVGGMLIAVISLILPVKTVLPFFIGIMLVLVVLPVCYSYKLFKQQV
jgi:uncharacterized membrane protein